MWTDTHCHLTGDPEAEARIAEAADAGIERLVVVGTTVPDSVAAVDLASRHHGVFATAGVHPHDAAGGVDGLAELVEDRRADVVAIGECGLDYHYLHSPKEAQREAFSAQLALAAALELPVVVHSREAWDDTFELIGELDGRTTVIIHCFTGGPIEAHRALDLGAMLSFSGIVTFASADDVREAARRCPLDRLLVETDSPFLAPVPHRGRPNRPALVAVVGEAVAAVRGEDPADLAAAVTANASAVFGWSGDTSRLDDGGSR